MDEELKTTLLYTRITLFLTVIVAFMMIYQLFSGNTSCSADQEAFQSPAATTEAMPSPNVDALESNSNSEL